MQGNYKANDCDICANRGPCRYCGRKGSHRINYDFAQYLKTRGSEFYRLSRVGNDVICKNIELTIENLSLYANMMTLRFKSNEPPLRGWSTFEQIFKGKSLKSVCTSYLHYEGGKFHLICAIR